MESAQIVGQITKVIHIIAQFFQKTIVLSLFVVISQIIAFNTDIFHHVIQSATLDKKITKTGNNKNQNNFI